MQVELLKMHDQQAFHVPDAEEQVRSHSSDVCMYVCMSQRSRWALPLSLLPIAAIGSVVLIV